MNIGIIGAGQIGSILARKFHNLGHAVKLANSRGAESLQALASEIGVTAVSIFDVVKDVDVVIVSIPTGSIPALPDDLFLGARKDVVVVDTANYYPLFRDKPIAALDEGLPESLWVSGQLGRPVVKAFNSIGAYSLNHEGRPSGSATRIALPVAGDETEPKAIVRKLVEEIGFDSVDGGDLDASWRQQPGTPAYCTDYDAQGVRQALDRADRARAPQLRDLAMEKIAQLPAGFDPRVLIELVRSVG